MGFFSGGVKPSRSGNDGKRRNYSSAISPANPSIHPSVRPSIHPSILPSIRPSSGRVPCVSPPAPAPPCPSPAAEAERSFPRDRPALAEKTGSGPLLFLRERFSTELGGGVRDFPAQIPRERGWKGVQPPTPKQTRPRRSRGGAAAGTDPPPVEGRAERFL